MKVSIHSGSQWLNPNLRLAGGLATSFPSLKANILLSCCVAATGISLPIGLSFLLITFASAKPIQAFAAGAALCSTSLGTTFTIMQTSGLSNTRLGVVLTSAAMMDDVVGLIMVQFISNLGNSSENFSAVTVLRPLFVSLGFGLAVPMACRFIVLPLTKLLNDWRALRAHSLVSRVFLKETTSLVLHSLILIGTVAAATYAGTSSLFAAYLAGSTISWWDSDAPHPLSVTGSLKSDIKESKRADSTCDFPTGQTTTNTSNNIIVAALSSAETSNEAQAKECEPKNATKPCIKTGDSTKCDNRSGMATFEIYYSQSLRRILKPFFFASIGFSIPITSMFASGIVWRGIVFTVLMAMAKMACGIWLLRFVLPDSLTRTWPFKKTAKPTEASPSAAEQDSNHAIEESSKVRVEDLTSHHVSRPKHSSPKPAMPISIYPASIIGCAMVARGEIGFLISALAEADGIFGEQPNGPLFLIVTWAIMLCTIIGPIMVGIITRRLRGLKEARNGRERKDVLGVWGLN
jgi:Kef-type K+ transport system membrane component KefB